MTIPFTVLLVDPKNRALDLDGLKELVASACAKLYPFKWIDYSTFKQATETKEMSLYIMNKNLNSGSSQDIRDISELKTMFTGGTKTRSYTTCMSKTYDPRYLIVDIHEISNLDYKDKFAIRFITSERIPISHFKLANKLAAFISKLFTCTVISNSQEMNAKIEAVARFENERVILHYIDLDQSGIIAKYTTENKISINKILERMDKNIEILMAPQEIRENEELLTEYQASLDFVKTISTKDETKETIKLQKDIAAISNILAITKELLTQNPNVVSLYARIFDPERLREFVVSEIKTQITNKEMWLT